MNAPDLINGSFEAMAALMTLNHCRVLLRDRAVAGVSIASMGFFTLWGIWNLWFYPHLEQSWSFAGGVLLVAANAFYVGLLCRFSDACRGLRRAAGRMVCRFKGCHYNTHEFHWNSLYFCTRCGTEITGRTFADLRPMSDEDLEHIHRMHEIYEEDHTHG